MSPSDVRSWVSSQELTPARVGRAVLTEPFRVRTWLETLYNLLAFALGLLWFVVFVTLLTLGVGLIPLALVGLVVLFVALVLAQGAAALERELAGALLDAHIDPPARRRPRNNPWSQLWTRVIDPVTWKELLYLFLKFPLGVASFASATALVGTAVIGVTSPLWLQAAVRNNSEDSVALWVRGPDVTVGEATLNVLTGLAALLLFPWVMRAFALLYSAMTQVLLGRSREQELEHEVERLADSRDRSVDVSTSERARIERDLHDGAQARLLSLAVDLGRARDRLSAEHGDSEAASMVAEAHEQAKQALTELRDLARGIHPAVLTDRGLDAALSSLAAGCPVPVQLDVDLPRRPSPRIEAVAYFVLAELLVNVARHSQAHSADVSVRADAGNGGDRVVLRVDDDGVGGAHAAAGSGLAGIGERVQSVDGTLKISSPPGGPTSIRVELPFS